MLSKLRYSRVVQDALPPLNAVDFRHLGDALGLALDNIRPVTGGTMGVCFTADALGGPIFLKTHSHADKSTLVKEGAISTQVYGTRMEIRMREVGVRMWMACSVLEQGNVLSPDQTWSLTQEYASRLEQMPHADAIVPRTEDFWFILAEADEALQELVAQEVIDLRCQAKIEAALDCLRRQDFGLCLCHGDLSNKNIMSQDGNLVAIDWEDTFWGVEGYDYLFWLTFFDNRRYYDKIVLGRTPWGHEIERAILVMILVLKCALSFRKNTYHLNSLSFDQRIMEVFALK